MEQSEFARSSGLFPDGQAWLELKEHGQRPNASTVDPVKGKLDQLLDRPRRELMARPSRKFRAHLVEIGWYLGGGWNAESDAPSSAMARCASAIEQLHLGSLIVDDIQDGSVVRRDGPALHCTLGVPHALAVGNWLYFKALRELEELELADAQKVQLYQSFHRLVEWAHYGQALDVCINIDRVDIEELAPLCDACLRYKTGSIVALAMVLGASLSGATQKSAQRIEALGMELGVYLQRLNDLGNLLGGFDVEKRLEDLRGHKPSFIWAFVVSHYGVDAVYELRAAVQALPSEEGLQSWINKNNLAVEAKAWIELAFEQALSKYILDTEMPRDKLQNLLQLKKRILEAYV